jgi:hypothetical protein
MYAKMVRMEWKSHFMTRRLSQTKSRKGQRICVTAVDPVQNPGLHSNPRLESLLIDHELLLAVGDAPSQLGQHLPKPDVTEPTRHHGTSRSAA